MRPGNSTAGGCQREGALLADLLDGLACTCTGPRQPDQVTITSVTVDSREAKAGALFVALAGTKTDGHRFALQALRDGCAAVVVESGKVDVAELANACACVIAVQDSHWAYAAIAANLYGHPGRKMMFVGITGTNGKTTITYLLEHILVRYGLPVGVIGTVSYRYSTPAGTKESAAPFTTPEPLLLQALLREMADAGVRYVVMEASSHALFQHRLGDIQCDVAAFTNLSRDHLDYHADMEEYFSAKTRLFTEHLKKSGTAVITFSEAEGRDWQARLAGICTERGIATIRAGAGNDAEVRLVTADSRPDGTVMTLATATVDVEITSPLAGGFNVDNIMTTIGICQALGLDLRRAGRFLADADGAPGRLERVRAGDDPSRPVVFVDYAHTPDALRKVLTTLTALPHRSLFCVFGCGGDRDTGKRPVMGAIAAQMSDVVVVTDDNPRTELSSAIIDAILPGIRQAGCPERDVAWLRERRGGDRGFVILPAREQAIAAAISAAGAGDIVVIAGKGHEKYQIGPAGRRFFDDCLEAQEALIAWNCTGIERAVGGRSADTAAAPFAAVSTDSRSVAAGDIFVALKGDNFDGHDFLPQAVAAGAGCLVVARVADFDKYPDVPRFLVDDTLIALGELAGFRRRLLRAISHPLVVGITGSCGKTTVKEMTAAIFRRQWPDGPEAPAGRVIKTHGNFNNLIGLPLSLLPLGVKHRAAILEMGMNHPGEIARLAQIADPDISCIVSVYGAHLEGLHTIAGVAAAKEELFAGTGASGILAINLDDEHVRAMAARYPQKKVTYSATDQGRAMHPDLWASEIGASRSGTLSYILHLHEETVPVTLHIPGSHNVGNSLAAAAIAFAAGCTIETIAAGLADFRPGDKRMQMMASSTGLNLINDAYNANPGSMAAGLATLGQLAAGTSMAILGDMLELGQASRDAHREIGRIAASQGVCLLALFGQFAGDTREGALAAGMDPERVRVFNDKERIAGWVRDLEERGDLQQGDWILIKASRGMRFETIVEQLTVSS